MASDIELWKPEDFNLFARLLRVAPEQLISHRFPLHSRENYFSEISHPGDLFLDPDTGVATSRGVGAKAAGYVTPIEISGLLLASRSRLLIVYQHIRGQCVTDRVDAVLASIRKNVNHLSWCSYQSATVAMLFLALESTRTALVFEHFKGFFGRHAVGRIRADADSQRKSQLGSSVQSGAL